MNIQEQPRAVEEQSSSLEQRFNKNSLISHLLSNFKDQSIMKEDAIIDIKTLKSLLDIENSSENNDLAESIAIAEGHSITFKVNDIDTKIIFRVPFRSQKIKIDFITVPDESQGEEAKLLLKEFNDILEQ